MLGRVAVTRRNTSIGEGEKSISSWVAIHFDTNPDVGGRPARDMSSSKAAALEGRDMEAAEGVSGLWIARTIRRANRVRE